MLRKNQKQLFTRALIIATMVALAVTLSLSAGGQAGDTPPKDKVKVFGKTYGQWSAEWWQWVAAIPAAQNPLFSAGQVDLSIGQEGNVWYLAGSWVGPVERQGTVPVGTALFLPVFNVMAYNAPGETYTEEELRDMAEGFIDLATGVQCTVDGEPVAISPTVRLRSIVRVQSPVFGFSGEVLGSSDLAVSDGYWVMLPALSAGPHDIQFYAAIPEWGIEQDVTYNLTVVP